MDDERQPDGRQHLSRSYRLDKETLGLIDRLAVALRDPDTGRDRTATDVLRIAVRDLARRKLHREKSE